MAKSKQSRRQCQFSEYKTYELEDGTKFLAKNDEDAELYRAKVNENANIIFGSSIDESLDGIINVSVVATGINKNQSIKSEEVIDRNINQTEANEIDEHSSKIEGQIDLESKIFLKSYFDPIFFFK